MTKDSAGPLVSGGFRRLFVLESFYAEAFKVVHTMQCISPIPRMVVRMPNPRWETRSSVASGLRNPSTQHNTTQPVKAFVECQAVIRSTLLPDNWDIITANSAQRTKKKSFLTHSETTVSNSPSNAYTERFAFERNKKWQCNEKSFIVCLFRQIWDKLAAWVGWPVMACNILHTRHTRFHSCSLFHAIFFT